ncbi:MAG TPA: hypothetical protein VIF14_16000 [Alphaproteobacteria bacterium]|jgi:hypothetical protein
MMLSLLRHGFGLGNGGAAALERRLRRFAFRAALRRERLRHRCDLALRAWGARRLAREMQAWPDERLQDIGLSRAELVSAIEGVRRPFRWVPDHDAAKMDPSRFGH